MAWNRLSLRTILRVANLILVVTPYEEQAKVKMGAPKNRILLFPGGIDDVSFSQFSSSDPQVFLKQLGIPTDSKIVAFLGTIENRKNPAAIAEVAERLTNRNDIQFVIGGRGDSEYADTVRKKAEGLTNVKYTGELSEKAKVQLIQNSYLNIILSRMEALGLTQLEFMFEGVPVITSGVGGQSWIVRNGEEGIQVKGPDDIDGAVNAVTQLADDKSKWQKLSSNAKERASKYTLTNLMGQLDSAITKEIENETGTSTLPSEVRSTISEPEYVVRTWSHGTLKVAVTERRMFIQRGRLSRSTLELSYSSIHSIEHVRQYRWKALLTGGILSAFLVIQHYVSPIISRTLTSSLVVLASSLVPNAGTRVETAVGLLWVVPISLAAILFLIGARKGYALHGATLDPIYLPPSFGEAVQYIREQQSRPLDNRGNAPNFPDEST
jgi:hypothetical protein